MKTILVPTEQSPTMVSALDTALLLARKFDGCIEGFPLRPAVADLVAMDPDSGLTMVAVKENDAEMVRQAETLLDRKSTRLNSSHLGISYAVFCLKKKMTALQAEGCAALPDLRTGTF